MYLHQLFLILVSIHASSREDATRYSGRCKRASGVSIHASSREDATCCPLIMGSESIVSIHASSREDATQLRRLAAVLVGFNPRVLAGGRDLLEILVRVFMIVSIHASSREDATQIA